MKVIFKEIYECEKWDGTLESAAHMSNFLQDSVNIIIDIDSTVVLKSSQLGFIVTPGDIVYYDHNGSTFNILTPDVIDSTVEIEE